MMSNPEISVIIPAFKSARYLPRALDSVLNQTFQDFEIICINDGSPDNLGEILTDYAARYPNISIITHEKNRGLSAARNNGLAAARGSFVYFLDSDDFIHPQTLELTHGLAVRHNADVVTFVWNKWLEKRNGANADKFPEFKNYKSIDEIDILVSNNPISRVGKRRYSYSMFFKSQLKLFRRSFLDGINFTPGLYWEDFIHTSTFLKKNPRTVFTNENLYYYSECPGSITHKPIYAGHIRSYHSAFNIIYDMYDAESPEIKQIFMQHLFDDARDMHRRITHAPVDVQKELSPVLTEWLCDMESKGWLRPGRISISRAAWFVKFKNMANGGFYFSNFDLFGNASSRNSVTI
ncbi:MAG: glycosyltransferase [Alphaproteobacteria bacterium]|nr:glycosyltransferase [Alphaproteobacteria bacterium]MCL2890149.1 glycosyltransferase [Alphaproteobacteria bacterium]